MSQNSILVATSTFSDEAVTSVFGLKNAGVNLVKNPFGRKLTEVELLSWMLEYKPRGIIAGLETFSSHTLQKARAFLRVISRVGAGTDSIDLDAAEECGISVFSTPDAVTPAVVELTIGLIFDLARRISLHDRWLRRGMWQKEYGVLISGRSFGAIGCGRIGKQMCLMMRTLGCEVHAFDSYVQDDWFKEKGVKRASSLNELVATSDIFSIHVPLSSQTKALIGREALENARPGALLVNTSRGGIVDETALYNALKTGKLGGAALDVFEQEPYLGPLTSLDRAVLTPHIGSYARETRIKMEQEALANLLRGLQGA